MTASFKLTSSALRTLSIFRVTPRYFPGDYTISGGLFNSLEKAPCHVMYKMYKDTCMPPCALKNEDGVCYAKSTTGGCICVDPCKLMYDMKRHTHTHTHAPKMIRFNVDRFHRCFLFDVTRFVYVFNLYLYVYLSRALFPPKVPSSTPHDSSTVTTTTLATNRPRPTASSAFNTRLTSGAPTSASVAAPVTAAKRPPHGSEAGQNHSRGGLWKGRPTRAGKRVLLVRCCLCLPSTRSSRNMVLRTVRVLSVSVCVSL